MRALLIAAAVALSTPAVASSAWTGEENCEGLFDALPDRLPGGARLDGVTDAAHIYRLPEGGQLRIDGPIVEREVVSGRDFAEAQANLFHNAPFGLRGRHGPGQGVVLAQVESEYNGEVTITGGLSGFAAEPGSAELSISPVVHLADWDGYAAAPASDRARWDAAICSQAHHELGHILVAAQVMTEAEDALTRVADPTQTGITLAIRRELERMMSDIKRRQDRYHSEIEAMGWHLADSRPYVELPFSWLGGDALGVGGTGER